MNSKFSHPIVAIQADSFNKLLPSSDGTLRLALEAQTRGFLVFFYEVNKLSFHCNTITAWGHFIQLKLDYNPYSKSQYTKLNLNEVSFVLVRQNPPFNMQYITSTYILENLSPHVKIINSPYSLRNISEKTFIMKISNTLPTIISKDKNEILNFCNIHEDIVIKPLYSFGGKNVVRVETKSVHFQNFLKLYLKNQNIPIMIQPYCKNIIKGEKRIVWVKNKWEGAFLKVPSSADFRTNSSYQSKNYPYQLTNKDTESLSEISMHLEKQKVFFAGVDMIGFNISEVNVTSVGAFVPFYETNKISLESLFWNAALN